MKTRAGCNRGFLSFIVAALAAVLLATVAIAASYGSWAGESRVAELDSRIAAERGDDAVRFLNSTLLDALLDSIYLNCGCGAATLTPENIFPNYSTSYAAYAGVSLSNLSTGFVSATAAFSTAAFSVSSCNSSFQSDANATISINSARSRKTVEAAYSFAPAIYRDAGEFNATVAGLAVRARCA
ncbi:MAG: hypothetical protein NTY90_03735 [Candidatus Micrarchaeota archaeon]|nr:hypothetical protein [Candidatus Micrarchaeota archaeon]